MSSQARTRVIAVAVVLIAVLLGAGFFFSGSDDGESSQVLTDLSDLVEESESESTPVENAETDEQVGNEAAGDQTAAVEDASGAEVTSEEEPPVEDASTGAATSDADAPEEDETVTTTTTESATPTSDAQTTTSESSAADSTTSSSTAATSDPTAATSSSTPATSSSTAAETTTTEAAAPETTTSSTAETTTTTEAEPEPPVDDTPRVVTFEVLETLPHDTSAFTQGLEISNGRLFESTGLFNQSSIRELDLETGEIIRNVSVPDVFAEGITIVGDEIIQLTWMAGEAIRYDLDTFEITETYSYDGQGWGLCLASEGSGNLVMSDGSSQLEFRDPDTFESLGLVDVTFNGSPINMLNELECIGDTVWANIWQSSLVIEIDPQTGNVLSVFDGDELRPESTLRDSGAVWNGLAYDPTDGTLLFTGKNWPTIFRLELN